MGLGHLRDFEMVEVERSATMIYVNQKQLDQVEYLIEQSTKGHHILFDIEIIRRVFALPSGKLTERLSKTTRKSKKSTKPNEISTEKHIENLILQPTIISKKAYLERLEPETYENVVRTYFSIVENNIIEAQKFSQ